jgi:predicted dehydrogenase
MSARLTFGVLGAARIAREKVIPGMQKGALTEVVAIASRDAGLAKQTASALGIPKAFGSYEALLADPDIDAVYIPLPNHLHAMWAIRALEAGKHVLCEKPIALTAAEASGIADASARTGKHAAEAFMFRHHPQWIRARDLLRSGALGTLRAIHMTFSFHVLDPANLRNRLDTGGGALYDVGCYGIAAPRFLCGCEPVAVIATMDRDPVMRIDRVVSAIMVFPDGVQADFTCSIQAARHQGVSILCSGGRVDIPVPFTPPPAQQTRMLIDTGQAPSGSGVREEVFPACDQYALQGDAFAEAILAGRAPPYPIADAVLSMRVIDAMFRSEESGRREEP